MSETLLNYVQHVIKARFALAAYDVSFLTNESGHTVGLWCRL